MTVDTNRILSGDGYNIVEKGCLVRKFQENEVFKTQ